LYYGEKSVTSTQYGAGVVMKHVCSYGNIVEKGAYWCANCPHQCHPAQLSMIFEYGEHINDIQILELLQIYPMTTLYRARRGKEIVLVKVAHNGYEEQLKREARLLSTLEPHPSLPILMPAMEQRPYGKFTLQEQVKYYLVLRDIPARFLRDMLQDNARPVPMEVAWLIVGIADVVAYLHIRGKMLVMNLSPDNIMVRKDKSGAPRPYLTDLSALTEIGAEPVKMSAVTPYTAPEQVKATKCHYQADVYSLAAIMYEMFVGEALFTSRLHDDRELRQLILNQEPIPLAKRRPELIAGVSDVLQRALHKDPVQRQPDIRTFAKGLRTLFGEVPPEPRRFAVDRRILAIIAFVALLLVGFFVMVVLSLS
jgi:serine/threonine protein kinase